jgi:hypothetical protein
MVNRIVKIISTVALICVILGASIYSLLDKYGDSLLNIYAHKNNIDTPNKVTVVEKVIVQATKDPIEPKIAKAITSLFIHEYNDYDKILHLVTIAVMKGENLLLIPSKIEESETSISHLKVCGAAHWNDATLDLDCSDRIEFYKDNAIATLLSNNTPITIRIDKNSLKIIPQIEINFPLN